MFALRKKKRESPGNTGRNRHFSVKLSDATSASFALKGTPDALLHTPPRKMEVRPSLSTSGVVLCVCNNEADNTRG